MAIHSSQGSLNRHTAAEAEPCLRGAAIPRHAGAREPGRPAFITVDHLGHRCGYPQAALCGTGP